MSFKKLWPDQIDAHHLLVEVGCGRTTATYLVGQTVYAQDDPADAVFFVQQGAVEFSVASFGEVTAFGAAEAGHFFGATCLYDLPVRIASATAIQESRKTSVT